MVEIKVVNPQTQRLVRIGETGEVECRGHNVMLEYWKNPEATEAALSPTRWYKTGDLGVMHPNGCLSIVGRIKELIIVGGENVYPSEVESVLASHPHVAQATVFSIPDERTQETVCAWITMNREFAEEAKPQAVQALRSYCQENLSYFKVPKHIFIVEEFPVTPATGKVQKFVMRESTMQMLQQECHNKDKQPNHDGHSDAKGDQGK